MHLNPERHARYRWAAEVVAGGLVLDAACGSGWGTALLAGRADEAVGLDLAPAAIAAARRDHGGQARFLEGDMRDLPFEGEEFDHVVCFEAIAHVAEVEPALDELRRVMRPGGMLLISSPNPGIYPRGNPLHLSELSGAELERLLSQRFANVAIHRQQSYFASLLGDEAIPAQDDRATEPPVRVTKTAGGEPGSELYTVAAASDGPLPPAPAWLALGENVDYGEQRRLLEEWRDRAVRAEAEALALRRELDDLRRSGP